MCRNCQLYKMKSADFWQVFSENCISILSVMVTVYTKKDILLQSYGVSSFKTVIYNSWLWLSLQGFRTQYRMFLAEIDKKLGHLFHNLIPLMYNSPCNADLQIVILSEFVTFSFASYFFLTFSNGNDDGYTLPHFRAGIPTTTYTHFCNIFIFTKINKIK